MANELYRSASDSMLGGVRGGLGRYFDVDPNLIRPIFVIFAVITGFGPLFVDIWGIGYRS